MLLGEHEHTIDDKNRLTLPAKFREAMAGGVVVTRGMDGCLFAYSADDWRERFQVRVAALDPLQPDSRKLQRHFFSGAAEAELDKQGRIMIPAALLLGEHLSLQQWLGAALVIAAVVATQIARTKAPREPDAD